MEDIPSIIPPSLPPTTPITTATSPSVRQSTTPSLSRSHSRSRSPTSSPPSVVHAAGVLFSLFSKPGAVPPSTPEHRFLVSRACLSLVTLCAHDEKEAAVARELGVLESLVAALAAPGDVVDAHTLWDTLRTLIQSSPSNATRCLQAKDAPAHLTAGVRHLRDDPIPFSVLAVLLNSCTPDGAVSFLKAGLVPIAVNAVRSPSSPSLQPTDRTLLYSPTLQAAGCTLLYGLLTCCRRVSGSTTTTTTTTTTDPSRVDAMGRDVSRIVVAVGAVSVLEHLIMTGRPFPQHRALFVLAELCSDDGAVASSVASSHVVLVASRLVASTRYHGTVAAAVVLFSRLLATLAPSPHHVRHLVDLTASTPPVLITLLANPDVHPAVSQAATHMLSVLAKHHPSEVAAANPAPALSKAMRLPCTSSTLFFACQTVDHLAAACADAHPEFLEPVVSYSFIQRCLAVLTGLDHDLTPQTHLSQRSPPLPPSEWGDDGVPPLHPLPISVSGSAVHCRRAVASFFCGLHTCSAATVDAVVEWGVCDALLQVVSTHAPAFQDDVLVDMCALGLGGLTANAGAAVQIMTPRVLRAIVHITSSPSSSPACRQGASAVLLNASLIAERHPSDVMATAGLVIALADVVAGHSSAPATDPETFLFLAAVLDVLGSVAAHSVSFAAAVVRTGVVPHVLNLIECVVLDNMLGTKNATLVVAAETAVTHAVGALAQFARVAGADIPPSRVMPVLSTVLRHGLSSRASQPSSSSGVSDCADVAVAAVAAILTCVVGPMPESVLGECFDLVPSLLACLRLAPSSPVCAENASVALSALAKADTLSVGSADDVAMVVDVLMTAAAAGSAAQSITVSSCAAVLAKLVAGSSDLSARLARYTGFVPTLLGVIEGGGGEDPGPETEGDSRSVAACIDLIHTLGQTAPTVFQQASLRPRVLSRCADMLSTPPCAAAVLTAVATAHPDSVLHTPGLVEAAVAFVDSQSSVDSTVCVLSMLSAVARCAAGSAAKLVDVGVVPAIVEVLRHSDDSALVAHGLLVLVEVGTQLGGGVVGPHFVTAGLGGVLVDCSGVWMPTAFQEAAVTVLDLITRVADTPLPPDTAPLADSATITCLLDVVDHGSPPSMRLALSALTRLVSSDGRWGQEVVVRGGLDPVLDALCGVSLEVASVAAETVLAVVSTTPSSVSAVWRAGGLEAVGEFVRRNVPSPAVAPTPTTLAATVVGGRLISGLLPASASPEEVRTVCTADAISAMLWLLRWSEDDVDAAAVAASALKPLVKTSSRWAKAALDCGGVGILTDAVGAHTRAAPVCRCLAGVVVDILRWLPKDPRLQVPAVIDMVQTWQQTPADRRLCRLGAEAGRLLGLAPPSSLPSPLLVPPPSLPAPGRSYARSIMSSSAGSTATAPSTGASTTLLRETSVPVLEETLLSLAHGMRDSPAVQLTIGQSGALRPIVSLVQHRSSLVANAACFALLGAVSGCGGNATTALSLKVLPPLVRRAMDDMAATSAELPHTVVGNDDGSYAVAALAALSAVSPDCRARLSRSDELVQAVALALHSHVRGDTSTVRTSRVLFLAAAMAKACPVAADRLVALEVVPVLADLVLEAGCEATAVLALLTTATAACATSDIASLPLTACVSAAVRVLSSPEDSVGAVVGDELISALVGVLDVWVGGGTADTTPDLLYSLLCAGLPSLTCQRLHHTAAPPSIRAAHLGTLYHLATAATFATSAVTSAVLSSETTALCVVTSVVDSSLPWSARHDCLALLALMTEQPGSRQAAMDAGLIRTVVCLVTDHLVPRLRTAPKGMLADMTDTAAVLLSRCVDGNPTVRLAVVQSGVVAVLAPVATSPEYRHLDGVRGLVGAVTAGVGGVGM